MSKARELAELGAVYDSGALSNRNLIINGAMQVSQRGTTFTTAANATQLLDRFSVLANVNGASKITYSQSTEAPTGFNSSVKLDVATALSVAAADYHIFKYNGFEQQDIDLLNFGSSDAKQITLSFWVKSNKTGTLAAEFQYASTEAGGATVELAKTYTINAANTWEHKTLTWPASTSNTSNASAADNGMILYMWIAAGTNYTSGSIATDWGVNSSSTRVPGQTNYLDSTSNELYYTGFQLEVGTEATPFEHRSFGDELLRCYRYYYQLAGSDEKGTSGKHVGGAVMRGATGFYGFPVTFPVPMRAVPTFTFADVVPYVGDQGGSAASTLSLGAANTDNFSISGTVSAISGAAQGDAALLYIGTSADDYVRFDAEL